MMPAFGARIRREAWEWDGNERSGSDRQGIEVGKYVWLFFKLGG